MGLQPNINCGIRKIERRRAKVGEQTKPFFHITRFLVLVFLLTTTAATTAMIAVLSNKLAAFGGTKQSLALVRQGS